MTPEEVRIEATKTTPHVLLSHGLIEIRGRSIPESAGDFYRPIEEWVSEYVSRSEVSTRVVLSFDFINTASTKWVYAVIKKLAVYRNVHEKVMIEWYFEKGDEELYELGQIIRSFIDCPFIYYETEHS